MRDVGLRVRYVRSVLEELDPTVAADVLLLAQGGAEARSPGHLELHLAALLGLAEEDAAGLRQTVAVAAVRRGHEEVAALLLPADSDDPDEENGGSPRASTTSRSRGAVPERNGRPLTLGERKALARRADRKTLDRALRDPHPEVIAILLGNPFLTEADVVRLAARRNVAQGVLRAVFRSLRWVVRPAVRRALVKNPTTPLPVALSLAPHLDGMEARDVAGSPELDPRLRRACDRRLGHRETVH